MRTFLKRSAKWACGTLVATVALGSAVQWTLSQRTLAVGPPPGRLVDVGGHRLHLLCQGSGSPTVILEPGLPGSSLAWAGIADEVAAFATVCTYDRAGYGWSETGPSPRTAGTIARELNHLLGAAGIGPPYILVGHSFGGLIMQLYAGHFPDQVAGMVLVDSSHPEQVSQSVSLGGATALGRIIWILAPTGVPRFVLPVPAGRPETREASIREMEEQQLMTTRSLHTAASEMAGLRESLRQARAVPPQLDRRPLIVLTEGRRRARFWHERQESLGRLSSDSEWRVIDGAGHFIHHDRPEAVVAAIDRVVEAARTEESQAISQAVGDPA